MSDPKLWNQEWSEYNTVTSSTMVQVPTVDCHQNAQNSDHRYQAPGMTGSPTLGACPILVPKRDKRETTRRLKHSLTGVIGVTVSQCNL